MTYTTTETAARAVGTVLATAKEEAAELRAERDRARMKLGMEQAAQAELLAYARATVAAFRQGDPSPISILEGLLEERGQLPPPDMTPSKLLAQGYQGGEQE